MFTSIANHALARVSNFMSIKQRKMIMNAFIRSQFSYCPLIWLCHSRTIHSIINNIHERALRIVYRDNISSFALLLEKSGSVSIHHRNLQALAIDIYIYIYIYIRKYYLFAPLLFSGDQSINQSIHIDIFFALRMLHEIHVTCYMLHVTCYMLHVTCYMLHVTCYMLHVTCYMLHVTCYMLHVTCYMLHVTCYMLHVTCYMLHVTCYMLHVTCYMLHVTCYMLHVTCYMLHVTCYMLHVTCYMLHVTYYILHITLPTKKYSIIVVSMAE